MDNRICNKCFLNLSIEQFTKGKYTCKKCRSKKYRDDKVQEQRNIKYRDDKLQEYIKNRTPLRNAYFQMMIQEGFTVEKFNKMFVKYEDFQQMKNNEEYDFAYAEQFKEFIHQPDYENGFVLDCVMCGKSPENHLNVLLFII
jgi:hypothetical protein